MFVLGLSGYIYKIYNSPINSGSEEGSSIILIPRGSTFDKVTSNIKAKGMLPYPRLYHYLAKEMGAHSRVQ